MMFNALGRYAAVALVAFLAGLLAMYYAVSGFLNPGSRTLDPALVSRVTVTSQAPLQGLNKAEAKKAGLISKDVAKNKDKAVLAAGTVSDDSGTSTVAAVLNTTDGSTALEVQRQLSEWMNRHEIGLGGTTGTLGTGGAFSYRKTFGRATSLYGDVRLDAWKWQFGPRLDDGHKYDGQVSALATWRF